VWDCAWICSGSSDISMKGRSSGISVRLLLVSSLRLLLLIWLCHSAASLFWLLFPRPELQQVAMQQAANRAVLTPAPAQRAADMALLVQLPFANQHRDLAHTHSQATIDTALALQLKGTVPSSNPQASRAIIADGELQAVVHLSELLPISVAGVRLAEVLPDRVGLDNNGRSETLWMDPPFSATEAPDTLSSGAAGDLSIFD